MLGMTLAPVHVQVQICTVCEQPRNTDEKMALFLTDPDRTPMDKLTTLVASGCCPLCGNLVALDSQTPDEYIERYINHLQG